MWKVIKKGKHNNFSIPGIHFGKTSETYEVMFDESCRYDLQGVDQLDWNKLFGWSYGLHHKNSIRVGWRYNTQSQDIDLCLYIYKDGKRIIEEVPGMYIGEKCNITISVHDAHIRYYICNSGRPGSITYHKYMHLHPTWGYNLDLYFGGDEVAPHDIRVWLKKV